MKQLHVPPLNHNRRRTIHLQDTYTKTNNTMERKSILENINRMDPGKDTPLQGGISQHISANTGILLGSKATVRCHVET